MSRVPWQLIQGRQPQAHLVVVQVEQADGSIGSQQLKAVQTLLNRLVSRQRPAGDYAVAVVREAGRPEVHWAFEDESDASRFAATFDVKATASYLGWASQRAFEVDGARLAEIESSFPVPKRYPRPEPTDGGDARRGSSRAYGCNH